MGFPRLQVVVALLMVAATVGSRAAATGGARGSAAAPTAAQAYAPAARNIVGVEMRSSCEAAAAPDVDRGVAFLLAMAPADARRAFERAADADPDCALAGWGRAMSLLPGDPLRVDDGALRVGREALRRVANRGTARERAYVASAGHLFDAPADVPIAARLRQYQDALRDLTAAFPDDAAATVLWARATLWRSTLPDDDFQREAIAIIERRFGKPPEVAAASAPFPLAQAADSGPVPPASSTANAAAATPGGRPSTERPTGPLATASAPAGPATNTGSYTLGAALTLLLALDRPGVAGAHVAKPAADLVAALATLPLPRHLPARTYARLGDWDAAIGSSEAAIKLAGTPASPELVYGAERDEVAAEWLLDAYLQQGRFSRAAALLADMQRALAASVADDDARARDGMRAALVRMRIRDVLARADWPSGREAQAPALGCADEHSGSAPACAFIQAYSAARLAFPGAKADMIAEAARAGERLGGLRASATGSVPELWRVLVRAAIAAGQEEHHELELLVSYAISLEEKLALSGQLALPLAPANELIGDLFMQINRFEEARHRYSDALTVAPNRARAMLGTARASVRLDDRPAAAAAYRQFLALWTHADAARPEIDEANRWLAAQR